MVYVQMLFISGIVSELYIQISSFQLIMMQKISDDSFDGTFSDNIKSSAYKSQFSNKKHKVVINVNQTQYAVVKHISRKNKWNLQAEPLGNLNFDLAWIDGITKQDIFARMNPHQKINHFPGMGILSRKNNLGKNLMMFRRKFPSDYEFFPITWHLPMEFNQLQAYHECRQQGKAQTFIVKPEAGCQGRGIYLTRNIDKLKYDKCVVQRYLHKPYLIDGLKFDLRIYVLVTGIDPLRIFVFEQGLARFATQPYKPPRSQNLDNMFMHLTNYAINKNSENFVFNESASDMNTGHKRSLTSIYEHIAAQGHDVNLLKKQINQIFIKTILTGYPTLSQTLASIHPDNHANDMCFQVLGFDVMLDHKLNPSLIEINYTPSFTTDTPLDRFIKKKLIEDTLRLIGVTEKWKKESKIKRDKEIQERMVTGKRKKYTPEERLIIMREEAKRRNDYERKNMGGFEKIFLLNEEQFLKYKKFYDFSMEVYSNIGKNEFYPSYQRPVSNPVAIYNHYFDEQRFSLPPKQKKSKDRQSLKNTSQVLRQNKMNDSGVYSQTRHNNMSSSHYGQQHSSGSTNKRVSSAKSRNERKERRVVYQSGESKKSLKVQPSSKQKTSETMDNGSSIFQNKMLQNILIKQQQMRRSENEQNEEYEHQEEEIVMH